MNRFTPFTNEDLDTTIERFGAMVKFFPASPAARAEIKAFLAKKVPHREALQWVTEQFCERIGVWHGGVELLGVLDTRYRPSDGQSYWSSLPGYTGEDGEAQTIRSLTAEKPLAIESRKMIESIAKGKKL